MGTPNYDQRRFRTTTDIVVPKGTLVLPSADGRGIMVSTDPVAPLTAHFGLEMAVEAGVIRELADGEA